MSLAWLYPAGFAALATLLLPLLIHLARRDQQAPLDFAALRWLRNDPRPRRRLRFDERLLLVLRSRGGWRARGCSAWKIADLMWR